MIHKPYQWLILAKIYVNRIFFFRKILYKNMHALLFFYKPNFWFILFYIQLSTREPRDITDDPGTLFCLGRYLQYRFYSISNLYQIEGKIGAYMVMSFWTIFEPILDIQKHNILSSAFYHRSIIVYLLSGNYFLKFMQCSRTRVILTKT